MCDVCVTYTSCKVIKRLNKICLQICIFFLVFNFFATKQYTKDQHEICHIFFSFHYFFAIQFDFGFMRCNFVMYIKANLNKICLNCSSAKPQLPKTATNGLSCEL